MTPKPRKPRKVRPSGVTVTRKSDGTVTIAAKKKREERAKAKRKEAREARRAAKDGAS